jgi:hypothetical protein
MGVPGCRPPLRRSVTGPRARARHHDWVEERSRALHQAVGEHLLRDSSLVDFAGQQLDRWEASSLAEGNRRVLPAFRAWRDQLDTLSLEGLIAFLGEDSALATRLRQSSPFAGVLSEEERLAIFERFESI